MSAQHYIIHIIMIVRIAFGIFSEFKSGIIFHVIAKFYCLCFVIYGAYAYYRMSVTYTFAIRVVITSAHKMAVYFLSTTVSLLSNGEYFYRYLTGLDELESKPFRIQRKGESLISLFIFILIISENLSCFLYQLLKSYDGNIYGVLDLLMASILFTGSSLTHMTRILIFELLWNRMKSLRMIMEKYLDFSDPALCKEQIESNVTKLEEYLKVYRKLLRNLKYAGNATKLLIIFSLPCYFFYVLSFTLEFLEVGSIEHDVTFFIDAVMNITLPLVPALLAELVTVEVEKIKLHLKRQLFVCPHDALRNRTYDALKFLELRPFKYTIWRAFSLDISLPLGLISLCTTYTIVVIQFSHVYG